MDCAHARPWKYNQKLGRLEQGGKCLAVGSKHNIYTALMEKCEEGKPSQEWIFTRFDYRGLNYEDLVDVKKNLNLIR